MIEKHIMILRVVLDKDNNPICSECLKKIENPKPNKKQEIICSFCNSPLDASVLEKTEK